MSTNNYFISFIFLLTSALYRWLWQWLVDGDVWFHFIQFSRSYVTYIFIIHIISTFTFSSFSSIKQQLGKMNRMISKKFRGVETCWSFFPLNDNKFSTSGLPVSHIQKKDNKFFSVLTAGVGNFRRYWWEMGKFVLECRHRCILCIWYKEENECPYK